MQMKIINLTYEHNKEYVLLGDTYKINDKFFLN